MPAFVRNGGNGHMVFGRGRKGYLLTIRMNDESLLIVEVWAAGMIDAIAKTEEMCDGEVVSALKLWARGELPGDEAE